jgi:hypothetical protein
MIYELRTYWAALGKNEALHNRFRHLTLGLFQWHNMEVIGFWTPMPATAETGDLVYILRFDCEADKAAAWTAFQNDAEWITGKASSEADGKLVERLTSVLLDPTDYSPLE